MSQTLNPGSSGGPFDEAKRARYLDVLKETGEKAKARLEVGVCSHTVLNHRRRTEGFKEAEEEALRQYRASIAEEIHRRAIAGVEEPVYWQGEIVGHVLKYSDRLLELHAKRHISEYRTQLKVDQTNVNTELPLAELEKLSPESQAQLREILKRERDRVAAGELAPDEEKEDK